jgi:hypothetical protein
MTNIMPTASGTALALLLAPTAGAAPATPQAGVLQIPGLRADLQVRQGKNFKLPRFRNQFMQQGFVPLASGRAAPLHDHSPTL